MQRLTLTLVAALCLSASQALAWSNHSFSAYRVFEEMPEVARAAPVRAEPLDVFLRSQQQALETLLQIQEQWAQTHLEAYPPRPAKLTFRADPSQSDEARRKAFLMALRVAPNSRFALYFQPDPWGAAPDPAHLLSESVVNTLPEQANSKYRFVGLKAGESVAALTVLASATDEPDYGLDINLWSDSPSEWGKNYGFEKQPFGNPALYFSTQAPFHMGFYHEDRILYLAAPFIKRTFPMLRVHQFSSLAALAFRSGHSYWGWRFTGLALHYLQDLTQPYHASLSPGNASAKLVAINLLAMMGFSKWKDEMIVLLSNRHLALEKFQNQWLFNAARVRRESTAEKSLRDPGNDGQYRPWSDLYARDVVARQSYALGSRLTETLLSTLPPRYVADPGFDFGVKEADIDLISDLGQADSAQRARLDALVAELLGNFGAHSRNLVRGVLKAGTLR